MLLQPAAVHTEPSPADAKTSAGTTPQGAVAPLQSRRNDKDYGVERSANWGKKGIKSVWQKVVWSRSRKNPKEQTDRTDADVDVQCHSERSCRN